MPIFFRMLPHSIWLVPIKENLVLALLVPGYVAPLILSLVTPSSALPQLSLVVLVLIGQWTVGHKEEALLRVG